MENKQIKAKIYEIIEKSENGNKLSSLYDIFMLITIVCSLIPLAFKTSTPLFDLLDKATVAVFIIDYALREFTANLKLNKGALSYLLYPFTPMAIIDLLCILPVFSALASGFKILKIVRLFRTLRVFRSFKLLRYSKSITIILNVIRSQSVPLLTVCGFACGYVLISALIIFNVEPDTFNSFFDAVYWATISLTTMGYGDIYPISAAGRVVTMLSSFVGIAIVALPSGIITAGYMDEIRKAQKED